MIGNKNEERLDKGRQKEKRNERVNLDTILVEEIGQFGVFQWRNIGLAAVVVVFVAWGASEYFFTTARIPTRCLIAECDSEDLTEFSPHWILNAVPTSGNSFDNCQRYGNTTIVTRTNSTCPKDLFDPNTLVPCEEYVYENTHSIVYDFKFPCDEWRRTKIGSIRNIGNFITLAFTGYLSDRFGRRVVLSSSATIAAIIGITRYWATTYAGFFISQIAETVLGSGGFSCIYILVMETVGPEYRVRAGAIINSCYAIGQVTLGFIVWAVPNWRTLTIIIYTPQLIAIAYFWIISESVRWYLSKGRYSDAEAVLKRAARQNGKSLSEKSLEALRRFVEEEKDNPVELANEPPLILQVLRNKQILIRTIVSPMWWITMTLIYYGLSINAVTISGNMYLNYIAVSAVEIPGYCTAVLLIDRVGRKFVLMGAFWVCAACQIAYIFLPEEYIGVSLTVYLVGKYCISMVITSLYVYTAELYPTRYRHSLFSFSAMMGRLGSIAAPLTPALGAAIWVDLPFALFGGFALVSGFLVLITPETLGTKLPDTMEEASQIGTKATKA